MKLQKGSREIDNGNTCNEHRIIVHLITMQGMEKS